MNRGEVARVVAVGRGPDGLCSVVAVLRPSGSVDLYPHGVEGMAVSLPEREWAKLVALEAAA